MVGEHISHWLHQIGFRFRRNKQKKIRGRIFSTLRRMMWWRNKISLILEVFFYIVIILVYVILWSRLCYFMIPLTEFFMRL